MITPKQLRDLQDSFKDRENYEVMLQLVTAVIGGMPDYSINMEPGEINEFEVEELRKCGFQIEEIMLPEPLQDKDSWYDREYKIRYDREIK